MASDTRHYPAGRQAVQAKYYNNFLYENGIAKTIRARALTAAINAGVTFVPAAPFIQLQVLDFMLIAIGGNATSATSINVRGTSGGSTVEIGAVAIAALTRSAVVRAGASNAVVLADGASFVPMDKNTALTGITVGSALTVSTAIDFIITYVATFA